MAQRRPVSNDESMLAASDGEPVGAATACRVSEVQRMTLPGHAL
jgi:hypothetical protein